MNGTKVAKGSEVVKPKMLAELNGRPVEILKVLAHGIHSADLSGAR
jgi:hypothetical protein